MKVRKIRQEKRERKIREIRERKEKMKEKIIRIYTEEKIKELVNNLLEERYREECEKLGGLTEERVNDLYELAEEAVQRAIPQCFGYSEANYHSLVRAAVNKAIRDEIYRLIQIKNMEEVIKLALTIGWVKNDR